MMILSATPALDVAEFSQVTMVEASQKFFLILYIALRKEKNALLSLKVQRLALIFLVTLGHSCPVWPRNWFIKKCQKKSLTL
jgi:hypothetical protein